MAGGIRKTPAGNWRAYWRDPSGRQTSKTFPTKRAAALFLAQTAASASSAGGYVSPHAGRVLFGEHAQQWMASWNNEATTHARDASIMRTHVLVQWGGWPLAKIDHMTVQTWITGLSEKLSPATVAECRRLTSAVLRSAVRNRLIPANPCEGIKVGKRRRRDTDDQIIDRVTFRNQLLPAVPGRYRALVAVAGGCGLRWGEAAGLCADAVDLDQATLKVIRTVTEVAGHTAFKPFPKSRAGRRTVPIPAWLVAILREHRERYSLGEADLIFSNEIGGAVRRTLFRTRVWRPSLARAGLLGRLTCDKDGHLAQWTDPAGRRPGSTSTTNARQFGTSSARSMAGCASTTSVTPMPRGWSTTASHRTWFSASWDMNALQPRSTSTPAAPTTRGEFCVLSTTLTTAQRVLWCPRDALLMLSQPAKIERPGR